MSRRLITIIMVCLLVLSLVSCSSKEEEVDTEASDSSEVTENDVISESITDEELDQGLEDNVEVVDEETQETGEEDSEEELVTKIVSAADAARLYNETDGSVVLYGIASLNAMCIIENGESVDSIGDLEGKIVYANEENTTGVFVLKYILSEYGMSEDVSIVEVSSGNLGDMFEAEDGFLCVADVEEAIDILNSCSSANIAVDVAEIWKEKTGCKLYESCVVYDLKTSDKSEAESLYSSLLSENESIISGSALLGLSIEESVVTGEYDMMDELTDFFLKAYSIDPEIIGYSIPDDAFYAS